MRAQARMRIFFAMPLFLLIWFCLQSSVFGNEKPRGIEEVYVFFLGLTAYNVVIAIIRQKFLMTIGAARVFLYATAIIDPLYICYAEFLIRDVAGLFNGFMFFVILGYGFRYGVRPMVVCTIAGVIGFSATLAFGEEWTEHLVLGFSLLCSLTMVPLYAAMMIRKLDDSREQLTAALVNADKESAEKSDFLAKISHEMRTPLTSIAASCHMIKATDRGGESSKRADFILGMTESLLSDINTVLEMAKNDETDLVLDTEVFRVDSIGEYLQQALMAQAEKKEIYLSVEVDRYIPKTLLGDFSRLSHTLLNFGSNAVKFTHKGGVKITMNLVEEDSEFCTIEFRIFDTGIGIPAEEHDLIFDRFYQVSSGAARQHSGSGLGLGMAKSWVEKMGGKISIESTVGVGSSFAFKLKLKIITSSVLLSGKSEELYAASHRRLLLAEDNTTNRNLIKEMLLLSNHQVATAENGAKALKSLLSSDFDAALIDYNLGDMTGLNVLEQYKSSEAFKSRQTPIIFVTADASVATHDLLISAGGSAVLHKPVSPASLNNAIGALFKSSESIIHISLPKKPIISDPDVEKDSPIFDINTIHLLIKSGLNPTLLRTLLSDSVDDLIRYGKELSDAFANNDIDRIARAAHELAGISSSAGALRLNNILMATLAIKRERINCISPMWRRDIDDTLNLSITRMREFVSLMPAEEVVIDD